MKLFITLFLFTSTLLFSQEKDVKYYYFKEGPEEKTTYIRFLNDSIVEYDFEYFSSLQYRSESDNKIFKKYHYSKYKNVLTLKKFLNKGNLELIEEEPNVFVNHNLKTVVANIDINKVNFLFEKSNSNLLFRNKLLKKHITRRQNKELFRKYDSKLFSRGYETYKKFGAKYINGVLYYSLKKR